MIESKTENFSLVGKGEVLFDGLTIGNASKLAINLTEDEKKLMDYRVAGGATRASMSRLKDARVSITLTDLSPRNLARATRGGLIINNGLANPNLDYDAVANPVIDATYLKDPLKPYDPVTNPIVKFEYTIKALNALNRTVAINFNGVNEVFPDQKISLSIPMAKLNLTKTLDFIGDDFAKLDLDGDILSQYDSVTKELKYFDITYTIYENK